MNCCEENVELGCIGSCSEFIDLPGINVGGKVAEDFEVKVQFADSWHCAEPGIHLDNDGLDVLYIQNNLNEDFIHHIQVYEDGVLLLCFTVKTLPELCH